MAQQPNICKTEYKSMFDTYQERTYSLRPSTGMLHMESWCQSIVVIVGREIVPSWCGNSGPITYLSGWSPAETPAAKAAEAATYLERAQETYVP